MIQVQSKLLSAALTGAMIAGFTGSAFAQYGFMYHHPRRAEVLRRDNRLGSELNFDRGYLGGHYGQLERQDIAFAAKSRPTHYLTTVTLPAGKIVS